MKGQMDMKGQKELTRQILTRAYQLISRPRGWVKGQSLKPLPDTPASRKPFRTPTKRTAEQWAYCAIGALGQAQREFFLDGKVDSYLVRTAHGEATRVLASCLSSRRRYPHNQEIVHVNDAKETRKKDVVKGFKCAIDKVK